MSGRTLQGYDDRGNWQVIDMPEPPYFWLGAEAAEPCGPGDVAGAILWIKEWRARFGRMNGLPGPA